MSPRPALSVRLARTLARAALHLFPPRFRRRFGADMRAAFEDRLEEAGARGRRAVLGAALATAADFAVQAVREWTRPALSGRSADDTAGGGWRSVLDALGQDVRFAVRSLRRRPGFTAVAVLTLALGIGAVTAIFSVVDGVLLTPLPYPDPDRIVEVARASERTPDGPSNMSLPDMTDVGDTEALQRVVGYSGDDVALTGTGDAELVRAGEVTGPLLEVFGLRPVLGREIRPEEVAADGAAVVVVSHAFWRQRLGGDPDVVGRTLEMEGRSHEIVGVAPEGFDFPSGATLWYPQSIGDDCGRGCHLLRSVGRLAPGSSLEAAREEVGALALRLQADFPDSNTGKIFRLTPLHDRLVADVRGGLWTLLGAVAVVLAIVCANVAGLLLVRAQTRSGEVAVRSALGASGRRLGVQVMVESLVLAAAGGAAGLGVAYLGVGALRRLAPPDVPRLDLVAVDGTVLAFTAGLALLVALLFGCAPAIRLARSSPALGLAASGRGGRSGRGDGARGWLLFAEVGLSVVLLAGAGLLLKSFVRLLDVDPGYDTAEIVRFSLWVPYDRYPDLEALDRFFGTLSDRVEAAPGVESVGAALGVPLGSSRVTVDLQVEGRPEAPPGQEPSAALRPATAGYFETLGIPLLRGRTLDRSDGPGSAPVAVVSRRLVDENFPGEDPIGQRIKMSADFGFGSPTFEIVGVVGDVRSGSLTGEDGAAVYPPIAQMGPGFATVHVRSRPGSEPLLPFLRSAVRELDPDVPLREVETLEEVVAREHAPGRFYLLLIGFFAVVAVGLAAMGLYGIVAYRVALRTREVGVRRALGASRAGVVRLLVGEGVRPAAWGVAAGLLAALLGGRVLEGLLFEVAPRDPWVLAGVTALLLAVVAVAAAVPAWRAARVPACRALRSE